jgi:hypothetical protein
MTDPTTPRPDLSMHLPLQACPIRRDDQGHEEAATACTPGGVQAANCGNLTGMARDLCYAEQYGIYF